MSKVITILGGNGFIGRRCISAVLNQSDTAIVNVISRSGVINSNYQHKFDQDRVKFIKGDCLSPESFSDIIDKSTGIIHSIGALLTLKADNDPTSYNMLNKESCLRVAKLASLLYEKKEMKGNKVKFVYISSEAGLPFPLSLLFGGYIKTKREAESDLIAMKNINSIILRPGFVVDAKDRALSILLKYPVDALNMFDKMIVKKVLPGLSDKLLLPAKSIQLEIVSNYAAAGSLGKLEFRIYPNEEMIDNYKNLNRY